MVATQSVAVLAILLAADAPPEQNCWLFGALCLFLLGATLYLPIITLVVYRLVFLPLPARAFTPPYWISMGALAITTLAGGLFVLHAPMHGPLRELVPFVKGFTLLSWVAATCWIPLLLMLELWRHAWHRVPLRHEADDWNIVFPLGMYTVGTYTLAQALGLDVLMIVPAIGVYVSLLAWLLVACGASRRAYGWRR